MAEPRFLSVEDVIEIPPTRLSGMEEVWEYEK
jgi:hypothetical protein